MGIDSEEWVPTYTPADLDVSEGDDVPYVLEVTAVEDPPEDQTVEVTVLDADTGEPIPHAWVDGICSDADSSADFGVIHEANEDGVVTVSLPPADTVSGCHLNARAEGYEMSDELGIDIEDPKDLTVELTPLDTDETDDTDESGDTDDGSDNGDEDARDDEGDTSDDGSAGNDEPSEGTTDDTLSSNESGATDGSDDGVAKGARSVSQGDRHVLSSGMK